MHSDDAAAFGMATLYFIRQFHVRYVLDAVDVLITDAPPPPDYAQKLAQAEVALVMP